MNNFSNTAAGAQKPRPRIILAVDDKPTILTAVSEMLSGQYKVMTVTSGKSALKAIERHTPELFLLDIEMPEMSGIDLAKAIRSDKRFEKTPIVFLTAKGTKDDVIAAMYYGGNDYLVKPVDKKLLLEKMKKFLK